jgi:hypothetical protein
MTIQKGSHMTIAYFCDSCPTKLMHPKGIPEGWALLSIEGDSDGRLTKHFCAECVKTNIVVRSAVLHQVLRPGAGSEP